MRLATILPSVQKSLGFLKKLAHNGTTQLGLSDHGLCWKLQACRGCVVSNLYDQTYQFKKWIKLNGESHQELKSQLGPIHPLTIRSAVSKATPNAHQ